MSTDRDWYKHNHTRIPKSGLHVQRLFIALDVKLSHKTDVMPNFHHLEIKKQIPLNGLLGHK